MKKVSNFFKEYLHWFIISGSVILCILLAIFSHWSENGQYRTFDGKDAQISEATEKFIEDSKDAMWRLMNEDAPTDEETIKEPIQL